MALHVSRSTGGHEVRGTHDGDSPGIWPDHAHSPCHITAAIALELSALGPVSHIVVPGNFHYLHATSAQSAFPDAKTWVCPGIEKKFFRSEVRWHSRRCSAPNPGSGEIDQVLVQGARIMREIAMYHRASRTLILVDLIENFTDGTPNIGGALKFWFKYVLRMWGKPGPHPNTRWGRNRPVFIGGEITSAHIGVGFSADRIVPWRPNSDNAHGVAAEAWSGVLGR